MNISARYLHIGTFEADYDGFYVDIVLDIKEHLYESVLFHEKYSIRESMFGVSSLSTTADDYIIMVEAVLDEYIRDFIDAREDEDGHDWKY